MKTLVIVFVLLLPIFGFAQEDFCEQISVKSELISNKRGTHLELEISYDHPSLNDKNIPYPGFILYDDKGTLIAQTTPDFLTYLLVDNYKHRLAILGEYKEPFVGKLEVYKSALQGNFKYLYCSKEVSFEGNRAMEESEGSGRKPNISNTIYLEYKAKDQKSAGRFKRINNSVWSEYSIAQSAIIGQYKETHRDDQYIYLIEEENIFQFDLKNKKILKNGREISFITQSSDKDVPISPPLSPRTLKGQ